ncbi:hypothetical protein C8R43DRAFT_1125675 [Mycena crocata]|nr:hypothetical protein C8R43DRAFT_1125675 [Mycena crocata]
MEPLSNVGRCANLQCKSGCGIFVPDTSGEPVTHPALVRCMICGCRAGQHIVPPTAGPPPTVPLPRPAPVPSATHNTMFGSRDHVPKASAASGGTTERLSGPFRAATQQREEIIDAARQHPLNAMPGGPSQPFNPAAKAQVEGDLNPHDSKSKKRKPKGSGREASTAEKKAKRVQETAFTVVLVEGTKAVAEDRYRRPGPDKILALSDSGYTQTVVIPSHSSPSDIVTAVVAKFTHIPGVATFGFRHLYVKKSSYTTRRGKQSKRTEYRLRPSKTPLDMLSWERASTLASPPGLKGFKNVVYIALKPIGPNLAFGDTDVTERWPESDQESRTGVTESESEASEAEDEDAMASDGVGKEPEQADSSHAKGSAERSASPSTGPTPNGKGKSKAGNAGDSDIDMNPLDDPDSDWGKDWDDDDPSQWAPYPPAHVQLIRLLQNMTKPEVLKESPWWRTTTMDHLKCFNDVLPLVAEILELMTNNHIALDVGMAKLKKHLLIPLDKIQSLTAFISNADTTSGLKDFDQFFAVGPGGIATVLPAFDAVYQGLAALCATQVFTNEAIAVHREVGQMSASLLACLRHLRAKTFRGLFDPKGGFRELAVLLDSPAAARILPAGSPESTMIKNINSIRLKWDSSLSLTYSLTTAFGNASDGKKMEHAVICKGVFGLDYFYEHVIVPFLDDVERDDYQEIYNILVKCCQELARKVSNRLKTTAGTGARAPSPPPDAGEGASKTGPSTRSRTRTPRNPKSGHFKKRKENPAMDEYFPYWRELQTDSDDDFTNTDSMEGSEWWKAPKEGPDIKQRRSRRHPQIISSGSESEPSPPPRKTPKTPPRRRPTYVEVDTPTPARPETAHNKDIREAIELSKMAWTKLVPKILTRFPHPDAKKRLTEKDVSDLKSVGERKRTLNKVYHPDRNMNESPNWRAVTALVAAAINAKAPS